MVTKPVSRQWLRPTNWNGRCRKCGKMRWLGRGICLPCRQPRDRWELVEAGVPCGSADLLALTVKHFQEQGVSVRRIRKLLTVLHPMLMENIRIIEGGRMTLRLPGYLWVRRSGWLQSP